MLHSAAETVVYTSRLAEEKDGVGLISLSVVFRTTVSEMTLQTPKQEFVGKRKRKSSCGGKC